MEYQTWDTVQVGLKRYESLFGTMEHVLQAQTSRIWVSGSLRRSRESRCEAVFPYPQLPQIELGERKRCIDSALYCSQYISRCCCRYMPLAP